MDGTTDGPVALCYYSMPCGKSDEEKSFRLLMNVFSVREKGREATGRQPAPQGVRGSGGGHQGARELYERLRETH